MAIRRTIGPAIEEDSAHAIKVSLTMPAEWLVRAFVLAIRRMDAASDRRIHATARDFCIAAAEALSWLNIIEKRYELRHEDVRALRFVRNRTHHHVAAAMYFDTDRSRWTWYPADVLPEPRREKYPDTEDGEKLFKQHFDAKGKRMYSNKLAKHAVRDVFDRVDPLVVALAPGADLS